MDKGTSGPAALCTKCLGVDEASHGEEALLTLILTEFPCRQNYGIEASFGHEQLCFPNQWLVRVASRLQAEILKEIEAVE